MMKTLLEEVMDMEEKEAYFEERTAKHIGLVQDAIRKICDAYPEFDCPGLIQRGEEHDASKLQEPERSPYIELTWQHKQDNFKGYKTPGTISNDAINQATLHHIRTNPHHPEYGTGAAESEEASGEVIDAGHMSDLDIAEMVADWQAMSEELKTNTAREWFEKQKNVRWAFTPEQEALIDKLLAVFEAEEVTEAKHSHDRCMECDKAPTVEVLWAEGKGHAWFCDSCFKKWSTEGDGKGEVCSVKAVKDGKAASKFADNKNPNIKDKR